MVHCFLHLIFYIHLWLCTNFNLPWCTFHALLTSMHFRKKPLDFWHIELVVRDHFKLCHKTKTKDITAATQDQGKYLKEQMRILSKSKLIACSLGKHKWSNHYWFDFASDFLRKWHNFFRNNYWHSWKIALKVVELWSRFRFECSIMKKMQH